MGLEHLFYCTEDAYREAARLSREYGVGIHTHCSEQKEEEQAVTAEFGRRSLAMLDHYGILGERTLLAHCVWLNDDEIARVADTGTSIAHCPVSNAKLASGVARVPEMLARAWGALAAAVFMLIDGRHECQPTRSRAILPPTR